ncbi:MAG TPA: chlorite dismutase family protein [Candidatus Limnocylindria bacterium]|nr:chlorite dismutase family protein [Candidatus Limnocylindria bacterium]
MNELYRYLTLALPGEWRRLPEEDRAAHKREFADAVAACGVAVHAYSLVGTRADADLLLWLVADDLEAIQRAESRLAATALWTWSARPYAYLAARRRSPYVAAHEHAGSEHARPGAGPVGDRRHLVVYPLTKKRTWYALPHQERTRIMAAHFAVGHRYPEIRIHTGYSFGIDDQEFVVAFEVDDVREFLALVADLRETESSAFTERETPIFVGTAMTIGESLDRVDGAAQAVSA